MKRYFLVHFMIGFIACGLGCSLKAKPLSWEKPVIIGASLSDGFYLRDMGIPFVSRRSKRLSLDNHFKAVLTMKHGPILNLGSNWTCLAAEPTGKFQVIKAREAKPTVVFAIDYLFWYLSADPKHRGRGFRDLTRLEFFEKGLAHLATLECPVLVGNVPDAKESVGKILSKKQYPGIETITKANARLVEWQKDHPNVVLMDLHGFHQLAVKNEEMVVAGQIIPAGQTRELYLQWDQIHPTPAGATAIAKVALETLEKGSDD